MPDTIEDAKTAAQAEMLANRLRKRFRHLAKWARRTGVSAFRLYDRDIPEIPLALDFYGDAGTPGQSSAALAGALYERPYEKDEAGERRWLAAMQAAAAKALGIDSENIFLKFRRRQRGLSQYEKYGGRQVIREAREGGLVFRVNLSGYLDTGLFLDRRLMRAMVRADAAGKRALNLFCYTGSFSVYAAAGGAAATDSVDLSNTYLDWAADNFARNGFVTGERHKLIRADARLFIETAAAARRRWDLIVLDPPAFSNSKKMRGAFDLRRDHEGLIARCLELLAPGGKLWFSANVRNFRPGALETALVSRFPGLRVTDLTAGTVDEDFRGRKTPAGLVFLR